MSEDTAAAEIFSRFARLSNKLDFEVHVHRLEDRRVFETGGVSPECAESMTSRPATTNRHSPQAQNRDATGERKI